MCDDLVALECFISTDRVATSRDELKDAHEQLLTSACRGLLFLLFKFERDSVCMSSTINYGLASIIRGSWCNVLAGSPYKSDFLFSTIKHGLLKKTQGNEVCTISSFNLVRHGSLWGDD